MPRARLGVVLLLPGPVAAEVEGLRRALGDPALGDVPAHITLVPPVNVADRARPHALAVLRDAAAVSPPLRVDLGPAATFWPATPVVYLGVGGELEALGRLHGALVDGPWARPTTYPFVPHVTVGPDVPPALIPAAVELLSSYRRATTLTSVSVLREEPGGAWSLLEDVALSGRHVVGRGGLELVVEAGATLGEEAAARLAPLLGAPMAPFTVTARRGPEVVGAATGATGTELWLDRLVVDPGARHQGVGHHLLRAVESVAAERGCRRCYALCPAGSTAAAWLEPHGWRRDLDLPAWRGGAPYVRLARVV